MENSVDLSFRKWLGVFAEGSGSDRFNSTMPFLVTNLQNFAKAVLAHKEKKPAFGLTDEEKSIFQDLTTNNNPVQIPEERQNDKAVDGVANNGQILNDAAKELDNYENIGDLLKAKFGKVESAASKDVPVADLTKIIGLRIMARSYDKKERSASQKGRASLQQMGGGKEYDVSKGPKDIPSLISREQEIEQSVTEMEKIINKAVRDSAICFNKLKKGTLQKIKSFDFDSIFTNLNKTNEYRNLCYAYYFAVYIGDMIEFDKDTFEKIVVNLITTNKEQIKDLDSKSEDSEESGESGDSGDSGESGDSAATKRVGPSLHHYSPEEQARLAALKQSGKLFQGFTAEDEAIRQARKAAGKRFGKFEIGLKNVLRNFDKKITSSQMTGEGGADLKLGDIKSGFQSDMAKEIIDDEKLLMALAVRCLQGLIDDESCPMTKEKYLCMVPASMRAEINSKLSYGSVKSKKTGLGVDLANLNCNDTESSPDDSMDDFNVKIATGEKCDTKFLIGGTSELAKNKSLLEKFFRTDWPSNDFNTIVQKNLFSTWLFGSILGSQRNLGVSSCADPDSVLHGSTFKHGRYTHPVTGEKVKGFIRDKDGNLIPDPKGEKYLDPHSWERVFDQGRNYTLQHNESHDAFSDIFWHYEIKKLISEISP